MYESAYYSLWDANENNTLNTAQHTHGGKRKDINITLI